MALNSDIVSERFAAPAALTTQVSCSTTLGHFGKSSRVAVCIIMIATVWLPFLWRTPTRCCSYCTISIGAQLLGKAVLTWFLASRPAPNFWNRSCSCQSQDRNESSDETARDNKLTLKASRCSRPRCAFNSKRIPCPPMLSREPWLVLSAKLVFYVQDFHIAR